MKILTMKNKIMFGVYLIYLSRKLRSPFVAESFAFVIFVLLLSIFVSIPSVLSNMSNSQDFVRYFTIAFSNTNSVVQIILVLALIPAIFLMKDIATLAQLVERRIRNA